MNQVAKNLQIVWEQIDAAAQRSGRQARDITLIAVSKLQPAALVRDAYAAGHRDFGENYAQRLRDRANELVDLADIRWHAIGPLQTNKVKYVARAAYRFHALDRVEIARALGERRRERPIDCFLEVNVGLEASKSGVHPDALPALYEQVRAIEGIRIVGLMCMPPPGEPESMRPYFRQTRLLAEQLELSELSMGTTDDYPVAIEEGATTVRVGRAIFGPRQPEESSDA